MAMKPKELIDLARKEMTSRGYSLEKQAMILGQMKKETDSFNTLKEYGSTSYFNKYDPKHNPKKAAELGNTKPGDGERYRGRGYIQITGKDNYKKLSNLVFGDDRLVNKPELLEDPQIGLLASLVYLEDRAPNAQTAEDFSFAINPGMYKTWNERSGGRNLETKKAPRATKNIDQREQYSQDFLKQLQMEEVGLPITVDGDFGEKSKMAWDLFTSGDMMPTDANTSKQSVQYINDPFQPAFELPSKPQYASMEDLLMDRGLMNPLLNK